MERTHLARISGPVTLIVGLSMIAAEIALLLTYDATDRLATVGNPFYVAAGVTYLLALCGLAMAIPLAHAQQTDRAGVLGLAAAASAVVGTMFLAGDLWFETFAAPWLGEVAPGSFDHAGGLLMVGGFASYALFAIGWIFYGIVSVRTRTFPLLISVAIVLGGAIGFMALVPPFGVPLGLAIAFLGGWMSKHRAPTQPLAPAAA
jgi:hypothetical protein